MGFAVLAGFLITTMPLRCAQSVNRRSSFSSSPHRRSSRRVLEALRRGNERMRRGDYDGALRSFRFALRLDPSSLEAKRRFKDAEFDLNYQRALADERRGEDRHAEMNFQRAEKYATSPKLERRLRAGEARIALSDAANLLRKRSFQAAAKEFQTALDLDPESTAARAGLSEALYQSSYEKGMRDLSRGLFVPAREDFRECLEYEPSDPDALSEIRKIDLHLKQSQELRQASRRRVAFLKQWTPRLGGIYLGVLLLSLYMGIKRDRSLP